MSAASPRRALIVVHSYYLRDTRPLRHATALAAAGWEVDVLCAREAGEPARAVLDGVRVHRLPARRKRGSKLRYVFEYASFALMALGAVTVRWARRRHRVVYVIGVPNFLVFSALLPRLLGARVVLDMRDPMPEFFRTRYGYGETHPVTRAMLIEERLSARFATTVLTVVPSMAALYARTGKPADDVVVVRNAPDPRLFALAGTPPSRDPGDRTMLYAGTVAARYGVDLAVRALARLRDEIPALRLRVVGDGDLVPALRDLARDLGVADRLHLQGPVPLDEIPSIVHACWLGVQPNRDDPLMEFSLSTKVVEWARLGLPVVVGTTRALLEAFDEDELLYHEPGNLDDLCKRILEAHGDPAELAARVERARAASQRFDFDHEIATLRALFER